MSYRVLILVSFFLILLSTYLKVQSQHLKILKYDGFVLPNSGYYNNNIYDKIDSLRKFISYNSPDIFAIYLMYDSSEVRRIKTEVFDSATSKEYDFIFENFGIQPYEAWMEAIFFDTAKLTFEGRTNYFDNTIGGYHFSRFDFNVKDSLENYPLRLYSSTRGIPSTDTFPLEFTRRLNVIKRLDTLFWLEDSLGNFVFLNNLGYQGINDTSYNYTLNDMQYKWYDPVNPGANWNLDSNYTYLYNYSTRNNTNVDFGPAFGLEMRRSAIFCSEPVMSGRFGLKYIPNSYRTIGNDGNRVFSGSLIEGPLNSDIPDSIKSTLMFLSNTLPVQIKLEIGADFTPLRNTEAIFNNKRIKVVNPILKNEIELYFSDAERIKNFMLVDLYGKIILNNSINTLITRDVFKIKIPSLQPGIYFLKITLKDREFQSKLLIE